MIHSTSKLLNVVDEMHVKVVKILWDLHLVDLQPTLVDIFLHNTLRSNEIEIFIDFPMF